MSVLSIVDFITAKISRAGEGILYMLLSPSSHFSAASLVCALLIGGLFVIVRRKNQRAIPLKVLARALFPKRIWTSPSGKSDIKFFLFNTLVASALFGGAILSFNAVRMFAFEQLTALFSFGGLALPSTANTLIMTIVLFVAYEFGYWLNHMLSHHIPFFWHFHKVHHSAESLSPLTNFRVHPVDSVFFLNTVAICTGFADAATRFVLGQQAAALEVSGANALLILFVFLLLHLQHSQLWIAFTGPLGQAILSPAHHQIHHSADPAHFNRNYGNCLAIWDRMYGTLLVPTRDRQHLTFGLGETGSTSHTMTAGLIRPFADVLRSIGAAFPDRTAQSIISSKPIRGISAGGIANP
jgi:sterol desaturase/sphingolipid hydroxylase (fatty acid hydroxylase superfamily)